MNFRGVGGCTLSRPRYAMLCYVVLVVRRV